MHNLNHIPNESQSPFISHYQKIYQSYVKLNQDYVIITKSNEDLQKQIQQKIKQTQSLNKKYAQVKKQNVQAVSTYFDKDLKRNSTTDSIAKQIQIFNQKNDKMQQKKQKPVKCPFQKCKRSYQTQVSLNLHMKIKHHVGPKKERFLYAKMIKQSMDQGNNLPNLRITLPPKFLQEYLQKEK